MAHTDRAIHFLKTAELTRSIAYYLSPRAITSGLSGQWLRNRISDTYYALSDMQLNKENFEEFNKHEEKLLDTLKYIVEYYDENGFTDPSQDALTADDSKVLKIPARWLQNFSIDTDNMI